MGPKTPSEILTVGESRPAFQQSIPLIHNLAHAQSTRVVWALQELHNLNGLQFKVINYPRSTTKSPDLLKISPMGKSPILTVEDLAGKPLPDIQVIDGVLMETRLILDFIAEHYGGKAAWEPDSDAEKRQDIYLREFAANSLLARVDMPLALELAPLVVPFPLNWILNLMFKPVVSIFRDMQTEHYKHMETFLTEERPFFGGRKLGLADFVMEFPVSIALGRGMCDPTKYPKIKAWHAMITSRKAFREAVELGGGRDCYNLETFGV